VNPIRVHLGPMPPMLRMIVGDLLGREPDIVIAGSSARDGDCLREARDEQAEIVIAQDVQHGGSTCLDLILAEPPLGVLAVAPDGHSAAGVTLARQPITLETGSPSILADAIRTMAAELGLRSAQRPGLGSSATGCESPATPEARFNQKAPRGGGGQR
jgi:hypothetical protein